MSIFKGLTISQVVDSAAQKIGQVVGTTTQFTTFTEADFRRRIDRRQAEFVDASHCLKKYAIIPCVSGLRTYRLPLNCLDGGLISVKFFDTSSSYQELDIKDTDYMQVSEEGYLTSDDSTPDIAFMGATVGNIQTMEVYPGPDTDGTAYASGDDTGISVGETLPTTTNNLTGTATGGGATTCVQSANVDFTDNGIVAGQYILNVTDGSYAIMSSFATTTVTHAALAGGSDNAFASDDTWLILGGEYMVVCKTDQADDYLFPYRMGVLSNITVPAYNFLVEFVPYPISFATSGNDDMYPEIPAMYHEEMAFAVAGEFLATFHEKTKEFQRAKEYEARWQAALAAARRKKESRPFARKPTRIRPGNPRWR